MQRLKSSYVASESQVCISTIQRLYAILKGQDLDECAEDENPNESRWLTGWQPKEIPPITYDGRMPIEFFDFIVIDECHRSIYNLWKQVLEYYDAFEVGLTATPDKRTIGYFDQNLVSEYSHDMAVADNVNVGYDVYIIDTKISKQGATLWKGEYIEHRERLSRKKRMELQDEDENYSKQQLDKEVHLENAAAVVEVLVRHPAVARVHYPGLAEHPGHALAGRQQAGFGAMVSFELEGGEAAIPAFLEGLQCFTLAESLGGVEALVAHPATMTHASMTADQQAVAGITGALLRLSIGIESPDDLCADLGAALDRALESSGVAQPA